MLTKWTRCVVFSCALGVTACTLPAVAGEHKTNEVWFVHATDPHLFVDPSKNPAATVQRQRQLNQKALADLLTWVGSLSVEGGVRFLILTGDFDIDPCWITRQAEPKEEEKKGGSPAPAKDCVKESEKTRRDVQVERVAELLAASPLQDIYLVPGNNDIAHEAAGEAALKYFNEFIDDVQKKIAEKKSQVRLHNLARCYVGGGDSECYADIAGTPYRLVGFPSYSFKNTEEKDSYTTNTGLQEKQMEKFTGLMEQARQAGKKVLIVTHVPEIDDPHTLAQDVYADVQPPEKVANPSKWSTWNVSKKVLDAWRDILRTETVAGVLAGHLHDSHKEIYRQPYSWSTVNEYRPDYRKLFLAPPLAVKKQDSSPIQARGFSLVHLWPDRVEHQLYWYNQEAGSFSPDFPHEKGAWKRWRVWPAIAWLWRLAEPEKALERLAVLLIAFLAAFLTVVQIWRIPADENPLTPIVGASFSPGTSSPAAATPPAAPSKPTDFETPFASKFGKTVISGLGGLAATAVLDSLENKTSATDKEFYIVWFIIFFFVLLLGLALLRGIVEAVRARVAVAYYPPPPPPRGGPVRGPWSGLSYWWRRFWQWFFSSWRGFWQWFFSLKVSVLVLFDTFVNLIQGKNQTRTYAFERIIIAQQRNVVRVADTIRQRLNDLIQRKVMDKRSGEDVAHHEVRVNISVLSTDEASLFYIARAPGSASLTFPKRSVAWVSIFTGAVRWYKNSYEKELYYKDIVLFDNKRGLISGDEESIHLHTHYQWRDGDYEAFAVFPVPWPQRALVGDYIKGGIHISFKRVDDFKVIWDGEQIDLVPTKDTPPRYVYATPEEMFGEWCKDPEVRAVLLGSIAVHGELLRGFNETIYKAYIERGQLD